MKNVDFCNKLLLGMCRTLDNETSSLMKMSKLRMNEVKDQEKHKDRRERNANLS